MSRSTAEHTGVPNLNSGTKMSKPWFKTESDTLTLKSVPSPRWETKTEDDDVGSYRYEMAAKAGEKD